jgi:hypothetical protein
MKRMRSIYFKIFVSKSEESFEKIINIADFALNGKYCFGNALQRRNLFLVAG